MRSTTPVITMNRQPPLRYRCERCGDGCIVSICWRCRNDIRREIEEEWEVEN